MEAFPLPGEVFSPGEACGLPIDICLQAGYRGCGRIPSLPCLRESLLGAGETLLHRRDRLPIKTEIGYSCPRGVERGFLAGEEFLFCLKRLSHPRNLFEADAEFERLSVRIFGTAALLSDV